MSIIQEIPSTERPRERCLQSGATTLSLRECLAVIIGTGPRGVGCLGLAAEILVRTGQDEAFFASIESHPDTYLRGVRGLGHAARARILAALELGRRWHLYLEKKTSDRPPQLLRSSLAEQALGRIPSEYRSERKEWLGFVPVNVSGVVGDFHIIEHGVRTHVNVDPVELFARILALRPAAFFIFNNHPSGQLAPSYADVELTRNIDTVARLMGLRFVGHWIVTARSEIEVFLNT